MSQKQVTIASRGKVSSGWLSSLESGRIDNPHPARLEALASVLHTTLADIYEEAGIIPSPKDLPDDAQRLLKKFRSLTPDQQVALLEFIERMYPSSSTALLEKKTDESESVARP